MALDEKEMKVWLGLQQPQTQGSDATGVINLLKRSYGDFDSYSSMVSDQESFSEHESQLTNEEFSSSEASSFTSKIQQSFTDEDSSGTTWDEYKDYVQNESNNFLDLETAFSNTSTWGSSLADQDGTSAAGIKVFEEAGVTKDGVEVPAAAVEVFGREVHFSQSGEPPTDTGSIDWSNLSGQDTVPVYTGADISADVTNNVGRGMTVTAQLTEDGEVVISKDVYVQNGATQTVTFNISKSEYTCSDYSIGGLEPIPVCWAPQSALGGGF